MKRPILVTTGLLLAVPLLATTPSERALKLRNQGIAELENEAPSRAEDTFRQLADLMPDDPLPYANLAIAALRQQKFDDAREWLGKARDRAPKSPRIRAIEAEIHHWSGDVTAALSAFAEAADAAPDDIDLQYALFRQAGTSSGPEADEAAERALSRLAKLRPENLVVLLQLGHRARENQDRAAATAVYLRIGELMWQAPRGADTLLERILEGLEAAEWEGLRSSALRLENVLKITPMYKEGLRELSLGIQGVPLTEFRDEPEVTSWGPPADVRFIGRRLSSSASLGATLAVGDLDGDELPEIARLVTGDGPQLEIRHADQREVVALTAAAPQGVDRLLLLDLDNDGRQDVLGYGPGAVALWTLTDDGTVRDAAADFGLADKAASASAVVDFDIEGDLDIALGGASVRLLRNSLEGPLEEVSSKSLPDTEIVSVQDIVASDLDRDGDVDLLIAHGSGLSWLDNLRQGRFIDRTSDLGSTESARRIAAADLDNDGFPDIVAAGDELRIYRNLGGRFSAWDLGGLRSSAAFGALAVFDADNDGRLDIAVGGDNGVAVLAQRNGRLALLPLIDAPTGVAAVAAGDIDLDGDLDLLASGREGLAVLANDGGNQNRHLSVRLRGLNKGNSKNNFFGLGSAVEVKAGSAYQFREADGETVHFGLGSVASPDLMRVVWPNGVPQNRLQPETNQRIVEEQLLKGSCPFLYADTGRGFEFVTDLLWGAPLGLPIAEDRYLEADPRELVYVGALERPQERFEARITEELWEAAFFDYLRLWVVDHPRELEVASSLRIQPGQIVPEAVHASARVRSPAAAWDAAGHDVTERIRTRDEIYADGWKRSAYQGVAEEIWTFTIDLGMAPGGPIRLLLDGWIFPTDASLNLALAQRRQPSPVPPRLEVETASGWTTLIESMGFPAGKTKTMVVDTPELPDGASRLRIVSSQWLSWDRIAWTTETADDEALVRERLVPSRADLRYRGFSALVRRAPNAPHTFDYSRVTPDSPWLPFPGRYTRYGDVRELLLDSDDRNVILAPGDEMAVVFDLSHLPEASPGMSRSLFLESHGWDKDADRNTGEGLQVGPLPFQAMTSYPYGPDEPFPTSASHREYVDAWLTRAVASETRTVAPTAP